ncbi:hypothetical protein F5H01DRAFT_10239 [Linnemannia elongata]|nr:hypothetical protein F5H01DRAFT_10239 [Linnemannia elongata]
MCSHTPSVVLFCWLFLCCYHSLLLFNIRHSTARVESPVHLSHPPNLYMFLSTKKAKRSIVSKRSAPRVESTDMTLSFYLLLISSPTKMSIVAMVHT